MRHLAEAFLESHDPEISRLERKFSSYSLASISKSEIRIWLRQFLEEHLYIGLKLLQSVDFYEPPRIIRDFRTAHEQFLATINDQSLQRVFFFPFGHAGKSGSALSYHYRTANNISPQKFKYNFTELTTLFEEEADQEYKLVFIDDFIGTGNQAIDTWERLREIPFPRNSEVFLLTLVGFDQAIREVSKKTDLRIITPRLLSDEDRIFSPTNACFDENEKKILKGYCERVGPWSEGFGDSQSLIVFHYRIPDNTISILRCRGEGWVPLFPRYVH